MWNFQHSSIRVQWTEVVKFVDGWTTWAWHGLQFWFWGFLNSLTRSILLKIMFIVLFYLWSTLIVLIHWLFVYNTSRERTYCCRLKLLHNHIPSKLSSSSVITHFSLYGVPFHYLIIDCLSVHFFFVRISKIVQRDPVIWRRLWAQERERVYLIIFFWELNGWASHGRPHELYLSLSSSSSNLIFFIRNVQAYQGAFFFLFSKVLKVVALRGKVHTARA